MLITFWFNTRYSFVTNLIKLDDYIRKDFLTVGIKYLIFSTFDKTNLYF